MPRRYPPEVRSQVLELARSDTKVAESRRTRSSRYHDQPSDVGVIGPAGGLADSAAQVRKLA